MRFIHKIYLTAAPHRAAHDRRIAPSTSSRPTAETSGGARAMSVGGGGGETTSV